MNEDSIILLGDNPATFELLIGPLHAQGFRFNENISGGQRYNTQRSGIRVTPGNSELNQAPASFYRADPAYRGARHFDIEMGTSTLEETLAHISTIWANTPAPEAPAPEAPAPEAPTIPEKYVKYFGQTWSVLLRHNPAQPAVRGQIRAITNLILPPEATTVAAIVEWLEANVATPVTAQPAQPATTTNHHHRPTFSATVRREATEMGTARYSENRWGEEFVELTYSEIESLAEGCDDFDELVEKITEALEQAVHDDGDLVGLQDSDGADCENYECDDIDTTDVVADNRSIRRNLEQFLRDHPELDPSNPPADEDED